MLNKTWLTARRQQGGMGRRWQESEVGLAHVLPRFSAVLLLECNVLQGALWEAFQRTVWTMRKCALR